MQPLGIPGVYKSGRDRLVRRCLGLLEGSSRHGYDLKRSYDRRFGEVKPIRFGQVYRTLSQLEAGWPGRGRWRRGRERARPQAVLDHAGG